MKKKVILLLVMILATVLVPCGVTYADGCPNVSPLPGMRSWYAGIPCENGSPVLKQTDSEEGAAKGINSIVWTIAGNIIATIAALIGYVSIGFIIWGGFTYIISRGDPGKLAKGKKTVVRAVIGLVICILANSIISIIIDVLLTAV